MKFLLLMKPAIWGAVMLLPFFSYGQWQKDLNTLPLGAMPMQYNSSFAGESGSPRFNTAFTYHLQSFMGGESYNYYASYDQFIPALRMGLGFLSTKGVMTIHFLPAMVILQPKGQIFIAPHSII